MTKYKTHAQVQSEMMQNSEFKAALEDEMRKERLQNTLAEWRRVAGLTSAQVAKVMGVNASTVSRMENNVTKSSVETLVRYAKACGIEHPTISI
ncbi:MULTISPECIES: helix-turn-helix domain-containing protein [Yersinia]|uniref:DNA-binding protein n=1 Tax=Yersinia pseudotuberculosis TaxID=633 RepID=A0A380SDA2_YERPU|nr:MULTISPECIES: helix-turn-helix transcriptional regulator [Yersinia]AIN14379.1 helix-turn-helix family protein [Yersinia pseudotuberculosis]AUQ43888.1 XRE family transcriptional regulator [Yersinia ruckeri]MBO1552111.1 helix-turn-helix domain-containing protein [Yersinia pseudotuberculosis]MBO1572285.1 helix-turn-helix domain-containing protein [Yersinia pseudotuberculosis]MBO1587207.1 helix-turn-helix domain-containing protein [Yersinia pseudotuberculosis]